jgi:hypothetical protein
VILQLVERDVPSVKRLQYWTEGVVDGSVALLARSLSRGLFGYRTGFGPEV